MPRKKQNYSSGASRGNVPGQQPNRRKKTPAKPDAFRGKRNRPTDYAAYEKEEATKEYMSRLFAQYDFTVNDTELERFWQYYLLLRKRNQQLDLTRIMGIEATVLKHFIDCAIVTDLIEIEGPLMDIGSGPGFPGGPIAIHRPDLKLILAESRGKRVNFLEELISELKLGNAVTFAKSIRIDSPFVPWNGNGTPPENGVRSVITRAVEAITPTLQRVEAFIPTGGKVIFMKGPNCGQEVTDAQQSMKGVYKMADDVKYDLPKTNQKRRLVSFEKR